MRILILGGTVFLGRALVEAARRGGHQLTLFNRGQSNPGIFKDVETITGDRSHDLAELSKRAWEAVIDTSGYLPRIVRASAHALAQSCEHYTFISSVSVYADESTPPDENNPVGQLADPGSEEITGETYGPLKALCENQVQEYFPGHSLIIRPGLIVGPHDPSDRFTYWPMRVARGGEVLAPGRRGRGVQFIDVRDLAEWILRLVEAGTTGVFNATGPAQPIAMEEVLGTCKQVSGSEAHFTWVSEEFLAEQKVGAWMEMPLWVPESDPANAGFFATVIRKALAHGLSFRALDQTIQDTLAWLPARTGRPWRAGINTEREAALLDAWHTQRNG